MIPLATKLPETHEGQFREPPDENPTRIVWELAWPAVALNSLQVVNTLLDRGFVGQLSASAVTAHGGSINVMFLMFSLAMALGTAATAIVSRAFGAGNKAEYRMASRQAVTVSFLAGLVLAGVTAIVSPIASAALVPGEDAIREMTRFLVAYGIGLPAIYLIQSLAGALRGVGDTRSPMVISGIQIVLHIVLNFFLINGPREVSGVILPGMGLGLVGAGVALSLSAAVAALIYLGYSRHTALGSLWHFRLPSKEWIERIFRIALPTAAMAILRVLSLTAFTLVLKDIPGGGGSVAIAAMGVGFAIESIMFMPSFGLSMAASALVGQSLGMGRPDRAERLGWVAGHHAALVTLALSAPVFFAAPFIASTMLQGKPEIAHAAATLIQALCVTEVMFAYAMVMIGAMQGAGDTRRPLWISIVAMWGLRVPLAYALTLPLGFGMYGAWAAMSISQAIQGIMSLIAFKQGAWKKAKV